MKKRKEEEEEVQEEEELEGNDEEEQEEEEEQNEEEEEEEEEDEENEEDEEWEEEEEKEQNKMPKEKTVPVKERLVQFEKQRQKIASKRTAAKANLPAERKTKRKITDEEYEVKEENIEKALIVEREVSPLAMITKEVPAKKKPKKSIAVYKEKVAEEEEEKTGVRGGHGKFISFISMMNEQKKEAVRNIGLGALLDFQLPTSSQQFVTWLCNNFEENNQYLYLPKNEKILIEFEDVKKIYGLPSGEVDIVEAKSDKASEEFSAFMASWKKIFGNKVPSVQKILKYYSQEDQIEAGPDANFITSFLVVTVNTLIKSTLSNQAYFKFLFSMMNHEQIRNLNWCKYVWETLLSTTAQYKKNLKQKDKATFFTGPLPLLTIFYFDRVQRMNFFPPRRIPLVSCWTKEIGHKRNKLEESGFGLGKVLPKINIEEKQTRKEFMDEFVGIIQAVGDNLSKLSDSLKKAQEFFPGNELVSKVEEFLSKMAKEPSLSQDEWSGDFIKALLEKEKELLDAIELEKNKAKKDKKRYEYDIKNAFDLGLSPSPIIDDDKLKREKAGTSTSTPNLSLEEIDESLASAMLNLKQRREEEKKENEIAKAKKMMQAESEVSEPASEKPKTTVEEIVVQEEKIVSSDEATVEPELHVSEMMPVTNVIEEEPAPEVRNEEVSAPQVIEKKVTPDGVEEQPAKNKKNESAEPQVVENTVAQQMVEEPAEPHTPTQSQVQQPVEAELSVGAEQSSLPSPKTPLNEVSISTLISSTKTDLKLDEIFEDKGEKEDEGEGNEKGDKGKRPQRIHKLPAAFSSPYLVKYRDLFKNLDTMHQSLADYVLSGQDNSEVLYFDGYNYINREDMKTLVDEVEVVDCVIDSWSKYLNAKGHKDKLFLSTVPYHIMCTNKVCPAGSSYEKRLEDFNRRVNEELVNYNFKNIHQFKQIFIPVLAAKHFYLLVINHYNATVDVIDNRPLPRNVKFEDKYEGHPEVVLDAFAKYMGTFGYEVEPMQKYEMNLVKMKWRSMKDYTNCGVYVMKHMETYTGDPEHEWICDLKANDTNQIRKLRVTFCGLLMLSKQNEMHESNINEAWRS
ncbi:uncharacterized protein [Spinacia oleracea]|uniref:Ubiquitin-like protease family profile domain-containing protein n=1 Tax=Spinacia oleracea TaxID=3562 RepID=A0ABM3R830_SPIOL|nr:uncharacterized protein LOC130467318 [Spinacia oleracea]